MNMNKNDIAQISEEAAFLHKIREVRTRNESEISEAKSGIKDFLKEKPAYAEKQLYVFSIVSSVFLLTMLHVNPSYSALTLAFLFPFFNKKKDISEGWKSVGYFVGGFALLGQIASIF